MPLQVERPPVPDFDQKPLVTCIPKARVTAWGGLIDPSTGASIHDDSTKKVYAARNENLLQVLETRYKDDTHFIPFHVRQKETGEVWTECPRLKLTAYPRYIKTAGDLDLCFVALVFDVDDKEEAHKPKDQTDDSDDSDEQDEDDTSRPPASDEWRAATLDKIKNIPESLKKGLGWYFTRGGIRLVWLLQPFITDPVEFAALLRAVREELAKCNIIADKLRDWGRCYRAPHVLRDGERLELAKDLSSLGPLQWRPEGGLPAAYMDNTSGRVLFQDESGYRRAGELKEPTTYRHSGSNSGAATGGVFTNLTQVKLGFELPDKIPQGERNDTLFRYASKLRGEGCEPEKIRKILHIANRKNCEKPISDAEIETIIASVLNYEPGNARVAPPVVNLDEIVKQLQGNQKPKTPAASPSSRGPVVEGTSALADVPTESPKAAEPPAKALSPEEAKHARLVAHLKHICNTKLAPDGEVAERSSTNPKDEMSPEEQEKDFLLRLPALAVGDPRILYTTAVARQAGEIERSNPGGFVQLLKELKQSRVDVAHWQKFIKKTMQDEVNQTRISKSTHKFKLGSEVEIARYAYDLLRGEDENKVPKPELVYDRGKIYRYNEVVGIWEPLSYGTVERFVFEFDGSPLIKEDGKLGFLKINLHMANHAVEIIQKDLATNIGFFNNAEKGLTFSTSDPETDVFVKVDPTGKILVEKTSPKQRSLTRLPCKYLGTGRVPKKFLRTLTEWFEGDPDQNEKIQCIQEMMGLFLIRSAKMFETAIMLLGDGANGKSSFLRIIEGFFVGNMISHVAPQDMDNEYRLAMLAEASLNTVTELERREIRNTESVKSVISCESQTAREIRQAPFNFIPFAGHLYSTNTVPVVRDTSEGFWRKWLVLTFNREFKGSNANKRLVEEILCEEKEEIASWFIDGAANVIKRNALCPVPSSEEAKAEWRLEADQVQEFLNEKCEIVPLLDENGHRNKNGIDFDRMYGSYNTWRQGVGHMQVSKRVFARRLKSLKIPHHRAGQNKHIYGIKLLPTGSVYQGLDR